VKQALTQSASLLLYERWLAHEILGDWYANLNQMPAAVDYWLSSQALAEEMGDSLTKINSLYTLGYGKYTLALQKGGSNYSEGAALLKQFVAAAPIDHRKLVPAYFYLAEVHLTSSPTEALDYFQEGLLAESKKTLW